MFTFLSSEALGMRNWWDNVVSYLDYNDANGDTCLRTTGRGVALFLSHTSRGDRKGVRLIEKTRMA